MAMNLGERTDCAHCGSVLLVCQNPDCRAPFPRQLEEADLRWGLRRFCSAACAQKMRQKLRFADRVLGVKPCPECKADFVQHRTESPASFEKRKFCSQDCASASRRSGSVSRRQERVERAVQRELPAPAAEPVPEPATEPIVQIPQREVWRPAAWR